MPAEARPDVQTKKNGSLRTQKRKHPDREDSPKREAGGGFRGPADELDKLAGALRFIGDQVHGTFSGPLKRTAVGVENAAQRLRDASAQDVVQAIEGFARTRPLVFVGVAALVGVGVGRFIKSSSAS